MVTFAIENLRLKELAIVCEQNRPMYEELIVYLKNNGYNSLHDFIVSNDEQRSYEVIYGYFVRRLPKNVSLYDGVARPYSEDAAKWNLLGWILRDAPTQRLRPMLSSIEGKNLNARRTNMLNIIKTHVAKVFPDPEKWTWPVISEVIIDRLEGSRRAIKGSLFEVVVRRQLEIVFRENQINLTVRETGIKLEGETFDVSVSGSKGIILMPVKTRETMGGGHAGLFTRDIHKAIQAAHKAGYECLPVIIAESWIANLHSLDCKAQVYIDKNPNQVTEVEPLLHAALNKNLQTFREVI